MQYRTEAQKCDIIVKEQTSNCHKTEPKNRPLNNVCVCNYKRKQYAPDTLHIEYYLCVLVQRGGRTRHEDDKRASQH